MSMLRVRTSIRQAMMGRRGAALFWATVIVAWGALYVFWLREYGDHLVSDGGWYVRTARHLYRDGVYSLGDVGEGGTLLPTSRFPPVFPLLFAASFALFGDRAVALEAVRVVLAVMAVGTIVFTYRIAALWSKRIGYLAATLAAFDLHMLATAMNYDLPDLAVAFFSTMGVFYLLRYFMGRYSIRDATYAALWLGVAMWTKVTVYLLWVPLLVLLAWFLFQHRRRVPRRAFSAAIAFLLVVMVFFMGWKVRNWYAVGTASFTSQSGEVLLHYHAAYTIARASGVPTRAPAFEQEFSRIQPPASLGTLSIAQQDDYLRAVGQRMILAHPLAYLVVKLVDIPNLLLGTLPPYYYFPRSSVAGIVEKFDTGVYVGHRAILSTLIAEGRYLYVGIYWLSKFAMLGLFGMACVGIVRMGWERRHPWALAVLLTMIAYILFVSTPVADPRYRLPLMPMLYVLAAYGIAFLSSTVHHSVGRTLPTAERLPPASRNV